MLLLLHLYFDATTAEIKSYAEESIKRFVAMVEREDKNSIKTLRKEVNALVNLATTLTEKTEARKTRQKDKKSRSSKAAKEESESESSSESEDESGDESDGTN